MAFNDAANYHRNICELNIIEFLLKMCYHIYLNPT